MKRCNLSVFQKFADQPSLYSIITPTLNCCRICRGGWGWVVWRKEKKLSANLESINWYLLSYLSLFQPHSLCVVQSQARNQSTYFPLDLWGLQAVFDAPPKSPGCLKEFCVSTHLPLLLWVWQQRLDQGASATQAIFAFWFYDCSLNVGFVHWSARCTALVWVL